MRVQIWGDNAGRLPQGDGTEYTAALERVLRAGDVNAFHALLSRTGRSLPPDMMLDRHKLDTMMRQLILAMPELADLHDDARNWMSHNAMITAADHTRLRDGRLVRKPENQTRGNDEPRGKGRPLPLIRRPAPSKSD